MSQPRVRGRAMHQPVQWCFLLCLCGLALIQPVEGLAESYVAGQFGLAVPNTLSHANDDGLTLSDLRLQNSPVYGAKLGHYLENLKYFGVETEAYTTTPSIKQQAVTVSGIPIGTQPGSHMRVTTWAFNLVYRYPGAIVQPYAGVGVGVFFGQLSNVAGSSLSVSPGLNVLAGLRVHVTPQVALFGEYKFNNTRLHFKDADADASGRYTAHLFVFGMGYHF